MREEVAINTHTDRGMKRVNWIQRIATVATMGMWMLFFTVGIRSLIAFEHYMMGRCR